MIILYVLLIVGVIDPQPKAQQLHRASTNNSSTEPNSNLDPTIAGVFHPDSEQADLMKDETTEAITSSTTTTTTTTESTAVTFPDEAVPGAYEGEFRITNVAWNDKLMDEESDEFKQLSAQIEEQLKQLAPDAEAVKVVNFRSGSVVVKFR